MTDLRKAAEMALEALEDSMYPQKKQFDAIVGLKQALAEKPTSEVVGWCRAYYSFKQEQTVFSLYNDQQECIDDTAEEGGIVYPLHIQGKYDG